MGHSWDTSVHHLRTTWNNQLAASGCGGRSKLLVCICWQYRSGIVDFARWAKPATPTCGWSFAVHRSFWKARVAGRSAMTMDRSRKRRDRGRWPQPHTVTCGWSYAVHRSIRMARVAFRTVTTIVRSRRRGRSPPPAPVHSHGETARLLRHNITSEGPAPFPIWSNNPRRSPIFGVDSSIVYYEIASRSGVVT